MEAWIKKLLSLEKNGSQVAESQSLEKKANDTADYLKSVVIYNNLVLEMIKLQGLEKTLEDMQSIYVELTTPTENLNRMVWAEHVRFIQILFKGAK